MFIPVVGSSLLPPATSQPIINLLKSLKTIISIFKVPWCSCGWSVYTVYSMTVTLLLDLSSDRGFPRLSQYIIWPQNRSIIQTPRTVLKYVVLIHQYKKLLNDLLFKTSIYSNVVFSKSKYLWQNTLIRANLLVGCVCRYR